MTNPDFFINRIFAYINEHLTELKQNFERQYAPDVQQAAIAPLYATLGSNGSFEAQVKMVFQHLLARMEDIKQKARDITDYIRTQKIATNNPLYNELDGQRRSLCSQIGNIRKQKVLEFMTDEGLLPNYSFPEKGVKLTANVKYMPQNSMPGGKRYYSEVIELVRPAVSAIRELAPGNFYYSGKYRLVVDGVETYDWNLQDSSLTKKRFCSKCDYIEDESTQHSQTCPKCGDASFGSDSNVHDFVKMNSAKSDMMRRDALSGDRSDERDIHHSGTHPTSSLRRSTLL
jgi:DEAD/DEAH box helicase domain-containing protein